MEQFKPSDVEIQACFRHENIAELYGAILWDETIHLFMEAGEGGSVMEKLESCGPMREFEIIWVTKHILKGLDFLHSKRIIHHDIKRMCVIPWDAFWSRLGLGLGTELGHVALHLCVEWRG